MVIYESGIGRSNPAVVWLMASRIKGGADMTDVSPDTIIKLRLWVTLLAGLLALTFIGHTDNFWLQLLSRGLEAVCIAMVIAIFVDVFLKRDLMRTCFWRVSVMFYPRNCSQKCVGCAS